MGIPLHGPHHPAYDPAASVARVRDLHRTFTSPGGVLTGLDLDLRAGEVVALMGRRGSGKTTLLRALAQLDRGVVGSGTLRLPESITVLGDGVRPWRRVLDNAVAGVSTHDALRRGRAALAEVDLGEHEVSWTAELSPEQQVRVALANALARRTELLLADEPLHDLDALAQRRLRELVRRLSQRHGVAALVITNDVHDAITLADRVVSLHEGRIRHDLLVREPGQLQPPAGEAYAALHAQLSAVLGLTDSPSPVGRERARRAG